MLNFKKNRNIILSAIIFLLFFLTGLYIFPKPNQSSTICKSRFCSEKGKNELLGLIRKQIEQDTIYFKTDLIIASKSVKTEEKYIRIIDSLNHKLATARIQLILNPEVKLVIQDATIDEIESNKKKRDYLETSINKKRLSIIVVPAKNRLRGFTFTLSENFGYYLGLGYNTIYIGDKEDIGLATFAHEIGHYFGLQHTFGNSAEENSTKEKADGSNCMNEGDYICDTAADLNIPINRNCQPKIGSKHLIYTPPIDNFMSYSPEKCRNKFTTEQLIRMNQFANTYRKNNH